MKIYNEVRINMTTGETVYEDYEEYNGPIAECKGSSGTSTTQTYDPAQTAAETEIMNKQFEWAKQDRNMALYGVTFDPNEKVSGYMKDGEFIESTPDDVVTQSQNLGGQWGNITIPGYTSPGEQPGGAETVTRTRGEMEGYDPTAQTSEVQYQQNLINEAQGILPLQAEAERVSIESQLKDIGFHDLEVEYATSLLPSKTDLAQREMESRTKTLGLTDAQTKANLDLLPGRTDLERTRMAGETLSISDKMTAINERAPVRKSFFEESMKDIDIGERKTQSQAEVEQAFAKTGEQSRRSLMDFGLDPSAPKYANILNRSGTEKATSIASARVGAGKAAEDEKYLKLRDAMTLGV